MKHARPAWAKKLNRSVTHRLAMKKTMLTQLVLHERLTTTLAKAQFIQHDAERLIDAAKTSTPAQLDLLASQLRQHDQTLPKMRQVLAQRYRGMDGGYTRLLRAGFDPADKSPVAILEFVGNPQD
ncbi:50S ribosomal protein L17, partial [Caulochytrium protostelioides]